MADEALGHALPEFLPHAADGLRSGGGAIALAGHSDGPLLAHHPGDGWATAGMAVGALSDAIGLQGAMLLPLGAALLGGLVLLLGAHWRLSGST